VDSQDLAVLTQARQWLINNHQVMLATVVKTWGSSPRPVGALLALRDDGRAVGSISGGCIEDDLLYRLNQHGMPKQIECVSYGETAEEARRLGLPCGGSMQLVLEPMYEADDLNTVLSLLSEGKLAQRHGDMQKKATTVEEAAPNKTTVFQNNILCSIYGTRDRLLLIGAGEVSQLLANIARGLAFSATVCCPRETSGEGGAG